MSMCNMASGKLPCLWWWWLLGVPVFLGKSGYSALCLDWQSICHIENIILKEILARQSEVFQADLGTLQGYQASIHVHPTVKPKFCRARSVPFTLCPKVERELDRLVEEGTLKPVQFAVYLGHTIDTERLNPLTGKTEAVQGASSHQDVAQLKSYLGLITYYSKFLLKL